MRLIIIVGIVFIANVLSKPLKREIVYAVWQTVTSHASEIVNQIPTKTAHIVTDIITFNITPKSETATAVTEVTSNTSCTEVVEATSTTAVNTNVRIAALAISGNRNISGLGTATATRGKITQTEEATSIATLDRTSNSSARRPQHQHHSWNATSFDNSRAPTSSIVTDASTSFPNTHGTGLASVAASVRNWNATRFGKIAALTGSLAPLVTTASASPVVHGHGFAAAAASVRNWNASKLGKYAAPFFSVAPIASASFPIVGSVLTSAAAIVRNENAYRLGNYVAPVATTASASLPTMGSALSSAAVVVRNSNTSKLENYAVPTAVTAAASAFATSTPAFTTQLKLTSMLNHVASPAVVLETQILPPVRLATTWTPLPPTAHPATEAEVGESDGSPLSDGISILKTINKWRTIYGLPLLTWDHQLELHAQKNGEESSHGVDTLIQEATTPGARAEIIAPGAVNVNEINPSGGDLRGDTTFELTLMAWLCEVKDPQLKSAADDRDGKDQCQTLEDNMRIAYFKGQTDHHDIILSPEFTIIGCGFTNYFNADSATNRPDQGIWVCDLA